MKILFVAKHNSGDNDDEGAIAHALEQLGHTVIRQHEYSRHNTVPLEEQQADFCLFLKWPTVSAIASLTMPRVFWYFDIVSTRDPSLRTRCHSRQQWFREVLPHCVLGFCTDGNWVQQDQTGKLRWLLQGADERTLTPPEKSGVIEYPLLFTGMIHHGLERAKHIASLQKRYGQEFHVLGDTGPRHRKHGRELASIFQRTKIVVAPSGPHSARYWSNRVYLTLGLGGFLLHPYCSGLSLDYKIENTPDAELICYQSSSHLETLIDYYLPRPETRWQLQQRGYAATVRQNLYRHRCERLLREVESVL